MRRDPDEVRPRAARRRRSARPSRSRPAGRRARPTRLRATAVATRRCPPGRRPVRAGARHRAATATSNPTSPNGESTRANASFASIDDPAIERVTIAGSPRAPASSRCANARNDQCSTSTSPRSYAPANDGIGCEVREGVARIPGDDLAHELPAEEQRAEARQRQHDQRELGVASPPLPHDLACRGGPARVPDDGVQHVAGLHVTRHRVGEGTLLVEARKRVAVHDGNVVSPGQRA